MMVMVMMVMMRKWFNTSQTVTILLRDTDKARTKQSDIQVINAPSDTH